MTGYIVLKQKRPRENNSIHAGDAADGGWFQDGPPVDAVSAEAAVRKAISANSDGGTFVAVPVRSWSPITVTVETTRVVKLNAQEELPT